MNIENILQLSKKLTPRGLGVKISKNPELKEEFYSITSFLPDNAPQYLRIWFWQKDHEIYRLVEKNKYQKIYGVGHALYMLKI